MKKIIGGKRYDTETAMRIGEGSGGYPGDFNYFSETLYRKKTGEYFLAGEGGPASKYAKQVELNSWSGGEKIIPLTYEQAREWGEEHLDPDDYENVFGIVEDLDKMVISLSMPAAVVDMLRKESARTGRAMSDIVAEKILQDLHNSK